MATRLTRYILVLMLLTSFSHVMVAQRFSTGVMLTAIGYHNLKFEDRFVFSPHSYMIYYAGNEKRDYEPSYGQTFNGVGMGLNFNVDYKRYMLSLEIQGGTSSVKANLIAPSGLTAFVYGTNTVNFKVSTLYTSIGLLGSYKLSAKANGVFIQLGTNLSFNQFEEEKDVSNSITFNLSPYELYGTLYTNENIYVKGLAGIGWRWKDNNLSARFSQKIPRANADYPSAKTYQIDMVFSRVLSFQKMRKGYKIYLDQ